MRNVTNCVRGIAQSDIERFSIHIAGQVFNGPADLDECLLEAAPVEWEDVKAQCAIARFEILARFFAALDFLSQRSVRRFEPKDVPTSVESLA